MTHTTAELMQFLADNDIKFIRLAFCDIFGAQKNIAIMAQQLPHAVECGVSFDASAITGFGNVVESDLFLFPDLNTFSILPWRPSESGVGRFFCNIRYPDGRPFEGDGRYLLDSLERQAAREGYSFLVGPECEFYLFETDSQGRPTRIPFDQAGYFDVAPADRGENVRRQICLVLEEMDVRPERSHHEQGPGQNEIDFRCASPLSSADNLMALRTAVKATAQENGLYASFLPKPLEDKSGSGLHINLSLFQNGKNLFEGFSSCPQPQAAAFLAGILRRAPELTAFANPLPGSYRRLGSFEAPDSVCWSLQNRSSLIRVPAASGSDCRMELRSPDPACNPYITVALLLAAGFEGVLERLPLPAPVNGDLFAAGRPEGMARLPRTLGEALDIAQESGFVRRVLPEKLLANYLAAKRREFSAYVQSGDCGQYELEHYFDRI